MNLTFEELQEINRGLLMRMDFLAGVQKDADKRFRNQADRFRGYAETARQKIKACDPWAEELFDIAIPS